VAANLNVTGTFGGPVMICSTDCTPQRQGQAGPLLVSANLGSSLTVTINNQGDHVVRDVSVSVSIDFSGIRRPRSATTSGFGALPGPREAIVPTSLSGIADPAPIPVSPPVAATVPQSLPGETNTGAIPVSPPVAVIDSPPQPLIPVTDVDEIVQSYSPATLCALAATGGSQAVLMCDLGDLPSAAGATVDIVFRPSLSGLLVNDIGVRAFG